MVLFNQINENYKMGDIVKFNDNRIYYLLSIAFITDYLQYLLPPLHYISFVCEIFIWIMMIPHFMKFNKNTFIFYIIVSYFIFLICRGLLFGNFYKYLIFDIHIYTAIVFLTFFNINFSNVKYYAQIPTLFAKLLIISIPAALLTFYFFGSFNDIYARSLLNESNSNLDEKMFLAPILIAPLIVPFISELKRGLKYVVIIATSLVLIYGILTATRSLIIICTLSFLSLITFKKLFKKTTLIYLLLFTVIVIGLSYSKNKTISLISDSIAYSTVRFEKDNDYTSGRDTELYGLFEEFNLSELIFGRGAGAEQKFGFWKYVFAANEHGISFTHFGFLYLILKGGFILLIIVYGLALYSLVVLFRHGERKYFFVILIYLAADLSHTQFINYFYVLFLWLSINMAIQLSITNKKEKLKLIPSQLIH